jgi:hypothetical protein
MLNENSYNDYKVMVGKNEVKSIHGYFKLLPLQISGGSMGNHASHHLGIRYISTELTCSMKVYKYISGKHY